MFFAQFFGFLELIPTAYAMNSLDYPIPIESGINRETQSIQREDSDFYEEIPDYPPFFSENPTVIPGCRNKETAKCVGGLIGILAGLAASTYFFVLSPNAHFNCEAYWRTGELLNQFLGN